MVNILYMICSFSHQLHSSSSLLNLLRVSCGTSSPAATLAT